MTERQTITLPFPPSVNGMYANIFGKGRVKRKTYKQWINTAGLELQAQRPKRFTERVRIVISINPPRKNCGDIDNRIKPILDLLTKHQVIADDGFDFVASTLCKWVRNGPECQVEIEVV